MGRRDEFFLSQSKAKILIDFAGVSRKDVFYDLGCGDGIAVCAAITRGHSKRAVGVECDGDNYRTAWHKIINNLTKNQLKKVTLWFGRFDSNDTVDGNLIFDYSDATVVYNSLSEDEDEVAFCNIRFKKKGVRVVRKDLPLVSYLPAESNRDDKDCWFFLMKLPLSTWKVRSKDKWARSVLNDPNAKIEDVYRHYRRQLERRGIDKEEIDEAIRVLKHLVKIRF